MAFSFDPALAVSAGLFGDILAAEPMLEKSEDTSQLLFHSLQERSLRIPRLVIYDAYSGFMAAIRKGFPGGKLAEV